MDTKELKCFNAVYEQKSINRAAAKMYITSQGLSRIIKNLENELGTCLFERSKKGVVPTKSAEFLYEKANVLIAQLNNIENGIAQLERSENSLRISCARGVLNALSIYPIVKFIKDNDSIYVKWQECSNQDVKQQVLDMKTDVGIVVGYTQNKHLRQQLIVKRNVILLVYEGHKLYNREKIGIKELINEKIVILNEEFQVYHEFNKKCLENGFVPDIIAKTVDSNFIYKLCKEKMGIGVLIDFSTEDFNMTKVKVIALEEEITWDIYQIYNAKNETFINIQLFKQHLEKIM